MSKPEEKNKEKVQKNVDVSVSHKKELNVSVEGVVAVSLGYLALLGFITYQVTKDNSKKECCNQNYTWL